MYFLILLNLNWNGTQTLFLKSSIIKAIFQFDLKRGIDILIDFTNSFLLWKWYDMLVIKCPILAFKHYFLLHIYTFITDIVFSLLSYILFKLGYLLTQLVGVNRLILINRSMLQNRIRCNMKFNFWLNFLLIINLNIICIVSQILSRFKSIWCYFSAISSFKLLRFIEFNFWSILKLIWNLKFGITV